MKHEDGTFKVKIKQACRNVLPRRILTVPNRMIQ